ncbi:MAG: ABC transporter ATP-binding protein [Clostridia bacterium]|nr:ABC transporter ATP-binding protein [Clostridia bacterium]
MIRLVGAKKRYRLGQVTVEALRGVDLEIRAGEFVSIMGPSGSGKSTLLNLIGCLDVPTEGVCEVAGRRTDRLSDNALAELRNRYLGFVFQDFSLLRHLDARANVELPLIYRGLGARLRRRLAEEALATVGLASRMHHRPGQLSGGEQQRVAIARALASGPTVILADEPTGALDTVAGRVVMGVFQKLNRERGITIVQVTHEPEIARHAKRLVRLRDGRVEEDAPVPDPLDATGAADALAAGGERDPKEATA